MILLHGYGGSRLGTLDTARPLVKAGYGVLMLDERATGESGGARRSYGWEDPPDILATIEYLRARPDAANARLGVAGCSVGAQIALQAAARSPALEAVWADGSSVVVAADNAAPASAGDGLALLSNWIMDRMMVVRLGISPPPGILDSIGQIAPRPIQLVAGGAPQPYFSSEAPRLQRYAQFAGPNAAVWVIPEAHHCDGPAVRPEEYPQRLVEFFDAALLP